MRSALFITYLPEQYSRSAVLKSAISRFSGYEVTFHRVKSLNLGELLILSRALKALNVEKSIVVVMSPAHLLTFIVRFIFKGLIVLDAGWPLSDSSELRRGKFSTSYVKDSLIDRLSMALADLVLVESTAQKVNLLRRNFYFKNTPEVSLTGVNEIRFDKTGERNQVPEIDDSFDETVVKVLFRGKYNVEGGIEFIQEYFSKKEGFALTICCPNLPPKFEKKSNVNYLETYLSDEKLSELFRNTDLAVGQLGKSGRIQRSIAHKIFEYGLFRIPTICLEESATKEIFDDEAFIYVEGQSLQANLDRIFESGVEMREMLTKKSEKVREQYLEKCSEIAIAKRFTQIIEKLEVPDRSRRG